MLDLNYYSQKRKIKLTQKSSLGIGNAQFLSRNSIGPTDVQFYSFFFVHKNNYQLLTEKKSPIESIGFAQKNKNLIKVDKIIFFLDKLKIHMDSKLFAQCKNSLIQKEPNCEFYKLPFLSFRTLKMYQVSSTIMEIAIKLQNHSIIESQFMASTMGCIIDMTQPLYRQKESNYIMELKLIDDTFNQTTDTSFLIKYLSVYLISDNLDELKLTSRIGDFVYLHKFMFSAWNGVKLRAKFYGSFESVYQIFSGEIEDDQGWKMERRMGKDVTKSNIEELALRIADLKSWLRIHFRDVFKPFIGVKIINNYCSLIQPFSMVVKVIKIRKNEFEHYLFTEDSNKNSFYLDLRKFANLLFKEDEWVYLRGVKQITVDKQVIFTEIGRAMGLPQLFADEYETQSNYKAIYRKTNKLTQQKKQTFSLTHITLCDQKGSTVKQLFELQDHYHATSRKQDIILQNTYLVKGAVVKYSGKIKLYHTDYAMIVHDGYLEEIPSQEKRATIDDKKLVYIFEGEIHVADRSILYRKECLKIMLFTNDLKSTFFDQKELQKLSTFIGYSEVEKRKFETLKIIHEKLQKLKQLSSFENPASLVLEPIRSDELIFRLINTKIV